MLLVFILSIKDVRHDVTLIADGKLWVIFHGGSLTVKTQLGGDHRETDRSCTSGSSLPVAAPRCVPPKQCFIMSVTFPARIPSSSAEVKPSALR